MKAKGRFISTLLVIDTFLVSYAVGFNSRHVLIVDPSLSPTATATTKSTTTPPVGSVGKKETEASAGGTHRGNGNKSTGKKSTTGKAAGAGGKNSASETGKSKKKGYKKSKVSSDH
jgi:hypothetical protein